MRRHQTAIIPAEKRISLTVTGDVFTDSGQLTYLIPKRDGFWYMFMELIQLLAIHNKAFITQYTTNIQIGIPMAVTTARTAISFRFEPLHMKDFICGERCGYF